ncbi:MAG: hypothetical protein RSF02_02450 [Bacilli bacterium]
MKKEDNNIKKELKKVNIMLYFVLALSVVSIILTIALNGSKKKDKDLNDTTMMNEVTVKDVLHMFESKKQFVLYIGRDNCSICTELLPTLRTAQKEKNFITQYMNLINVDRTTEDWKKLVKLLNAKTTASIGEDEKSEKVTETYGYFVDKYGFTPMVVVINNGKQNAGFIGTKTLINYKSWLESSGI